MSLSRSSLHGRTTHDSSHNHQGGRVFEDRISSLPAMPCGMMERRLNTESRSSHVYVAEVTTASLQSTRARCLCACPWHFIWSAAAVVMAGHAVSITVRHSYLKPCLLCSALLWFAVRLVGPVFLSTVPRPLLRAAGCWSRSLDALHGAVVPPHLLTDSRTQSAS